MSQFTTLSSVVQFAPLADLGSGLQAVGFAIAMFCIGVLCVAFAFLPTLVAWNRRHPQATAIFVCNVIGIFLLIPWIVALVWAFVDTQKVKPNVSIQHVHNHRHEAVGLPEDGSDVEPDLTDEIEAALDYEPPRERISRQEVAQVRSAYKAGYTVDQIARVRNIHPRLVRLAVSKKASQ